MKKDIKGKILIILGVIVLTIVMAYSFTNGFTVTLDEAFGVSSKTGAQSFLFGELKIKNALISVAIIVAFYAFVLLRKKKK